MSSAAQRNSLRCCMPRRSLDGRRLGRSQRHDHRAKVLAASMVDLCEKPQFLREVRQEFEKKRGDVVFNLFA
jgi:hypothetical protein